jgi:menaquinone-dependent protoporphyrinogen oxidase
MARVLAIYGTMYGHTEKVVRRFARVLGNAGHDVTMYRADVLPADEDVGAYAACLVAASVKSGRHQASVRRAVRRHLTTLDGMPTAFVSVCGALAPGWEQGRAEAAKYVDRFRHETGWRPTEVLSVAGALAYTRYGLITRWIMKLISKRTGRPTDTSRDYEFTDWVAVDAFAERFALTLGSSAPAPACACEVA